MRSDHIKRHMKIHVDLSFKDPKQLCKDIVEDNIDDILSKKTSKDETSTYSEKPKVNNLHSVEMDESPHCKVMKLMTKI